MLLWVVVKTHLLDGDGQYILAGDDVDDYSLHFQIEFNFRDAKQYWGLEDFMNVTEQAVANAVNLSFLMVNLSAILLRP